MRDELLQSDMRKVGRAGQPVFAEGVDAGKLLNHGTFCTPTRVPLTLPDHPAWIVASLFVEVMLLLEDVKKAYVEPNGQLLPILEIPRFFVDDGEQMVLVGPSGCGKTTLLHVIAGISRADSGRIKLDGIDIARYSEAMRDRIRADKIGYVFQTFNLLPGFTALENVLLGMTFARGAKDKRRARQLLDRVGLGPRVTHKPTALSVGEQQRVAVARALANRPRLLLADEPTANVDPANQQSIVNLIRETCREEKVALVMVTHSLEVAQQFDRVDRLEDINQVINHAKSAQPQEQPVA